MKYETILFDLDGTILDFEKSEHVSLEEVFDYYKIEKSLSNFNLYKLINQNLWNQFELGEITTDDIVNNRIKELVIGLGRQSDINYIDMKNKYHDCLKNNIFYIDKAMDVLNEIAKRANTYIVTNGVSDIQRARLEITGINKIVKKIFISEELGCQKPSKMYFYKCFKEIENLKPSTTIIIGDSLSSDIKGGNNAGIDTCWYNPKNNENDIKIPVTYEIKKFSELLDIIK